MFYDFERVCSYFRCFFTLGFVFAAKRSQREKRAKNSTLPKKT